MAEQKKELKTYTWKGKNKQGREISGETDVANDAILKAFLARQGLTNVVVKEKPKPLFESRKDKKQRYPFLHPPNGDYVASGYARFASFRLGRAKY